MPRLRRKVNRSALIREYLTDHPDASTSDVKEAMALKRVRVSDAIVQRVLYQERKKRRQHSPTRRAGRAVKNGPTLDVMVSELVEAKRFAERVGGVEKGHALLSAYQKLGS
jgi:hypothetical protein